jgi:hypothetical protein
MMNLFPMQNVAVTDKMDWRYKTKGMRQVPAIAITDQYQQSALEYMTH